MTLWVACACVFSIVTRAHGSCAVFEGASSMWHSRRSEEVSAKVFTLGGVLPILPLIGPTGAGRLWAHMRASPLCRVSCVVYRVYGGEGGGLAAADAAMYSFRSSCVSASVRPSRLSRVLTVLYCVVFILFVTSCLVSVLAFFFFFFFFVFLPSIVLRVAMHVMLF